MAPGEGSRVRLYLLRGTLDWIHRQQDRVVALRLRVTQGLDVLDATAPNHTPDTVGSLVAATYADAEFTSFLIQGQGLRRVSTPLGDAELFARADVQVATGSLFSLEAFAVGGSSTVRGFHENEVVADNGALGSFEFRLPILPTGWRPHEVRIAPFVDIGYVWDDDDPDQDRFDRLLPSAGLGLLYRYGRRFEFNAYWGLPLLDGEGREGDPIQDSGFHLEAKVAVF